MQISDTGSTLEPKHIRLIHNALWNEFRHISDLRDSVKRTQDHFKTHRGQGIGSLSKCISELDLQVYEVEYVLDYVATKLEQIKEVTK